MRERKSIVSIIEERVGALVSEVRQKEIEEGFCSLGEYQRGELVSLAFLKYTLNNHPMVREMAMRGLIRFDRTYNRESVTDKIIDRALFVLEDKDKKPATSAVIFLQGHACDRDYSSKIREAFNELGRVDLTENGELQEKVI